MIGLSDNGAGKKQFYERLSAIFSDIGQVFLATMIIPFFTNKNYNEAYIALLVASVCWAAALWVIKESE